jgi:hypothetical protein
MYSFTIKSLMVLALFAGASAVSATYWAFTISNIDSQYVFVQHETFIPDGAPTRAIASQEQQ